MKYIGENMWGRLAYAGCTICIVAPFIISIILPSAKRSEQITLLETSGNVSYVPIVVMILISSILATIFIAVILQAAYHSAAAVIAAVLFVIAASVAVAAFPSRFKQRLSRIEKRFIDNINERENRRTGRENNIVSDLHLAYMKVGHDCPFVGEKLLNLDLRSRYGVNLVNIQRAGRLHPVPSAEMRIFPGDVLGVIATEDQIQRLLPLVEAPTDVNDIPNRDVKFIHFAIGSDSPIVNVTLEKSHLREDYGALLVAVQRGEDDYISPTPSLTFKTGDILWIVGDPKQLAPLKG